MCYHLQLLSTIDQFNLIDEDTFLFLEGSLDLEDLMRQKMGCERGRGSIALEITVLSGSKLKDCLVPERVLMKICIFGCVYFMCLGECVCYFLKKKYLFITDKKGKIRDICMCIEFGLFLCF